jgi:CheY-like chemotaxis protein
LLTWLGWLKNWEFLPQVISDLYESVGAKYLCIIDISPHTSLLCSSEMNEAPQNKVKRWEVKKTELPLISIVDDDESVREAVESLLGSVGYKTEVFSSAEGFLNSGVLHDTDCLVVDVRMPGMSGLELQRLLNIADYRVPIIFISAHDDGGARTRGLQAGAVAFLQKPFSEDALLRAISASLEMHRDDQLGKDESM